MSLAVASTFLNHLNFYNFLYLCPLKSGQMNIVSIIQQGVVQGAAQLYHLEIKAEDYPLSTTRKEFEGDYTLVVFPFTKHVKKSPEAIGQELGAYLVENVQYIVGFNVIKGFLNLVVDDQYWRTFLQDIHTNPQYGIQAPNGRKVMVEYCSPNTNKPLHLGHIRNILLGWSVSKIYAAAGYEVVRVQIINDRGIAICKSMLAWQKFAAGATPESTGTKSDHFVGDYYVLFEQKFQEEYKVWQQSAEAQALLESKQKEDQSPEDFFKAYKDQYFNLYSTLGKEARAMLLAWEAHDPATLELWKRMNGWVYAGFDATFDKLGVNFDKLYYESDTYLLGRETVDQGLHSGVFYRLEDGSVWIDLEDAKLDKKLVLRKDGTSVYITQDIGTAQMRYRDFGAEKMIYVVADEQNYHFQVLFEIMKRLGEPYAQGLYHLSYGMVDLPTGKMKSREGTVVDADDLIEEVVNEAWENSKERGTLADLSSEAQKEVIRQIGLAALKFFIVKVHPKKRMVFDPKESVDLQGQTGPYVQNAFVRCSSMLNKAGNPDLSAAAAYQTLETAEKDILAQLYQFPEVIQQAAETYDPSMLAMYSYELAKAFHRFWHDYRILQAESESAKAFRIQLSMAVRNVLRTALDLLGIETPDRM
jgi:arginyl-tRNA synthetase